MPSAPTPWIGLAALVAMFVIPFLPSWLFEGPRIVRHRPSRHVCADCGERWSAGHTCAEDAADVDRPRVELWRRSGGPAIGRATPRPPKQLTSGRRAE